MLFTKDPKTQQPVDRSASGETESTVRTARNPRLQQLRANVILNDDIIYEILTIAAGTTNSDLQRREALSQYALVCQTWGRAAQSLLFRHVFLQIRPAMMSLLGITTQQTERGRRLSRYIRSATIKLSRSKEAFDPPALPMIHGRHLPALLCHMPRLEELHLMLGDSLPDENDLKRLANGPRLRILILEVTRYCPYCPLGQILAERTNPWPQLEKLVIKYHTNLNASFIPDPSATTSPKISLDQLVIECPSDGKSPQIPWLLQYSSTSLTHLAPVNSFTGVSPESPSHLQSPHIRNIISLTLGDTVWDNTLYGVLHSLDRLRELRFLSTMVLVREFPLGLPDNIEHLVMPNLFALETSMTYQASPLTFDRPALLKTCRLPDTTSPYAPIRELWRVYQICPTLSNWTNRYGELCKEQGIDVEFHSTTRTSLIGSWPEIPPSHIRIGHPSGRLRREGPFEPSPSQIDLTDFTVIRGKRLPMRRTPAAAPAPVLAPVFLLKFLDVFQGILSSLRR